MTETAESKFPEDVRRRSARILATVLALQAIVALAGAYFAVTQQGRDPTAPVTMGLALVAAISGIGAVLEWGRARVAEVFALAAAIGGFALVLTMVLAGLWQIVPFQGVVTIGAFLALTERYTVRDEERHKPKHA